MDGLEIEFLDVDLARQAGDQAGEERAWTRALQQAPLDTSRNRFLEIANRAEQLGNQRVAERAWVAAIRVGSGRLPLYRDLMPLIASLSAQSRSADLLELFRILLRFEPQNLELQNNYLYLALIHGLTPPQEALAKFELLAKDNPDMPALASGAALAALMTGEPAKALASLQYISSTPESSMMRFALLGTATLLNGDADGARPLLAKVNWNRFLNQEILIFRKLQVDSQVANLPLPELRIPPGDDSSIEWQSAQQRLERANELLPPLPPLHIPGSAAPDPAASEPQAPPR
jgi:tetratricopeptide (TPR) repeat protein